MSPDSPEAGASAPDLHAPELYLNRELSQLEFNFRVLAQAKDPRVPLLERLRYLCISCTNLDEFFEIRGGSVRHAIEFGLPPSADGLAPVTLLNRIPSLFCVHKDVPAKNMKEFISGWVICLDESMSSWLNRWTCPGWIFCPRKPHPFGNEWHTACCGLSGILFAFELVEGKDAPPQIEVPHAQHGKTTGLLL